MSETPDLLAALQRTIDRVRAERLACEDLITRLAEDEPAPGDWAPPTCEESPGECVWEENTVGFEEQEHEVWFCQTHHAEWDGRSER